MGGNVHVFDKRGNEYAAAKIDLSKISRNRLRRALVDLFLGLNYRFKMHTGAPIWPEEAHIMNGKIFNGSAEAFFDDNISDVEFKRHKSIMGDIDVTVPDHLKVPFWEFLNTQDDELITKKLRYIGNNMLSPHGLKAQINTLFEYYDSEVDFFIQVDFEFVPYEGDLPSAFSKFSHSSPWTDMQFGLKGVHHKYLLRALAGGASQRKDVQVITKARGKPQSNPNGVQFNKFSVDRGLRINAYVPVMDGDVHRMVNDLPAYYAVEPKHSTYITDVKLIAHHMLGTDVLMSYEIDKMSSFIGVVTLMGKYLNRSKVVITLDRLAELYWGAGAQGFERNNPALDREIKMHGWTLVTMAFPFYKCSNINTVMQSYYDNYRITEIST